MTRDFRRPDRYDTVYGADADTCYDALRGFGVSIAVLRACVKPCNKCKESNFTNTCLRTYPNIKNADVALGIRTAQHIHAIF